MIAQESNTGRKVSDFLVIQRAPRTDTVVTITHAAGSEYSLTVGGVTATSPAATDAITSAAGLAAAAVTAGIQCRVDDERIILDGPVAATAGATGGGGAVVAEGQAGELASVALADAVSQGAVWYATCTTRRSRAEIEDIAAWTETAGMKIFVGQTFDAQLLAANYDPQQPAACVASGLKARGYNRTALVYHRPEECAAAAVLGAALPFDPGTITWAYQTLVGVTPARLSDGDFARLTGTAQNPAAGKNVMVYTTIGGSNRTARGMMASGLYIDARRAGDWLDDQMTVEIANRIYDHKLPFTRKGLEEIKALIFLVLTRAQEREVLSGEAFKIKMPALSDISDADRSNRYLNPPPEVQARLSGAIHHVAVRMTVSA